MDSRTGKVLAAILIGGLLGIATVVGMAPNWWPLGLVVGFLSGYLSYDFRTVCRAVPKAWQAASGWDYKAFSRFAEQLFLALVVVTFSIAELLAAPVFIVLTVGGDHPVWALLFATMSIVAFFMVFLILIGKKNRDDLFYWRDLWIFNPIKFYLWDIPRVLFCLVIPSSARFSWYFIRLIHSELRLLCGLEAALCSMVFHYTGNNVFLGLFVGLACGLLQFEILSKRVLKVVPFKAS